MKCTWFGQPLKRISGESLGCRDSAAVVVPDITATFKSCRTRPLGVGQEGSHAADVGLVFCEGWLNFLLICTRPFWAVESHRKATAIAFPYSTLSCHALLNNTIVMRFGGSFQVIRAIKYSSFTSQCWDCSFFFVICTQPHIWQALLNHRGVWITAAFHVCIWEVLR